MIIHNEKTGLLVYPNFDSCEYMGTYTIVHNELKYISYTDEKFFKLQVAIAMALKTVLEKEDNDDTGTTDTILCNS